MGTAERAAMGGDGGEAGLTGVRWRVGIRV
jgi:hypothetical protein